jgi:hypothetical protein
VPADREQAGRPLANSASARAVARIFGGQFAELIVTFFLCSPGEHSRGCG